MTVITSTAAVNAAVADAKGLPDLVAKLDAIDPALGQQITGKALIASKSPPAVLIAAGLAWASAHYGLGWSENFCVGAAGTALLVAGYAMRYFSSHPISGFFTRSKVAPPAAS